MMLRKLTMPAFLLTAALVGVLTFLCASRALALATIPNASLYSYSLAAGAVGPVITPPANQPCHVWGTCLTSGVRGIGHIALLRVYNSFLEWVGQNSPSAATTASGFSSTAGVNMVSIEWQGRVVLEVLNANQFQVRNESTGSRSGNVLMIW
jgi:hypothetical protein